MSKKKKGAKPMDNREISEDMTAINARIKMKNLFKDSDHINNGWEPGFIPDTPKDDPLYEDPQDVPVHDVEDFEVDNSVYLIGEFIVSDPVFDRPEPKIDSSNYLSTNLVDIVSDELDIPAHAASDKINAAFETVKLVLGDGCEELAVASLVKGGVECWTITPRGLDFLNRVRRKLS